MIWFNGKRYLNILIDNKIVSKIWYSGLFIWQLIRSCFGSGMWRSDRPWIGTDKWKNNK